MNRNKSLFDNNFWDLRESCRSNFILSIVVIAISLQMIDTGHIERVPFIVSIFYLAYHKLSSKWVLKDKRKYYYSFSLFIAFGGILGMIDFISLACGKAGERGDHTLIRMVLRRMLSGEVILPIFYCILNPLLATLGGMNILFAKVISFSSLFGVFVYAYLIRSHYQATSSTNKLVGASWDIVQNKQDIEEYEKCGCVYIGDIRQISLLHDFILVVGFTSICWTSIALSSELATKYINLLSAGRSADLVLNHILKNSISGAACLIELDNQEQSGSLSMNPRQQQVLNQLYRTMRWCTMRQVLLDMIEGSYETAPSVMHWNSYIVSVVEEFKLSVSINILKFKAVVLSKDQESASSPNLSDKSSELSEDNINDESVVLKFDEQLLSLALGNALSNCIVHGDPESQVVIEANFDSNNMRLNVIVENGVSMARPFRLSQDELQKLKKKSDLRTDIFSDSSDVSLSSTIRSFVIEGSKKAFQILHGIYTLKIFKKCEKKASDMNNIKSGGNLKRNTSMENAQQGKVSNSPLNFIHSTGAVVDDLSASPHTFEEGSGCGLRHISMATRTAGGYYRMKYDEKYSKFLIQISVPATLVAGPVISANRGRDISSGGGAAAATGVGEESLPTHLKVCAIDDSKLICKGYQKIVLNHLKADLEKSHVCCPASKNDVDKFLNIVLGRDTPFIEAKSSSYGGESDGGLSARSGSKINTFDEPTDLIDDFSLPADICILDQNIEIKSSQPTVLRLLGTDLAKELRSQGFEGVVLIRSADSGDSYANKYMAAGHVDGSLGKSESHTTMVQRIKDAYLSKKRKMRDDDASDVRSKKTLKLS